jgi:ABC-type branched-subunit amino acid transport system substrate-binding protein
MQRLCGLFFILALFPLVQDGISQTQQSPRLRIGVIAPLSGGVATWGLSVRHAIELANNEMAEPAELFFEDEETCIPTRALSAYQALQSVKKVDIVIMSCLEGGQAIAPIARKDRMPLLISGRSSHEFQNKNPNALSWLSLLDYEGKAIAQLIADKNWKRGTAMVWSGYFGVQFAQGIRNAIVERAIDFTYNTQEVDQGSNPVGAEVQRLLRDKPEVVFLMMSEPAAAFVVKQLKIMNYTGSIVLQSSMLQTYDQNARAPFDGALQQKFPGDEVQFKTLQAKLRVIQGQEVADDFVFSYDGFKALYKEAAACKANKSASLESCLNEKLRDEQWREGASGKFRFMKDGSTERPMVFRKITKEGFE